MSILETPAKTASLHKTPATTRECRKLSARALTEQLQISQTRVVNVENANEVLELQTIARFATQLGSRLAVQFIPENENDPAMLIPLPN